MGSVLEHECAYEEGTERSVAWSAGASRFSWMRKRVLIFRKTSVVLLLLPQQQIDTVVLHFCLYMMNEVMT